MHKDLSEVSLAMMVQSTEGGRVGGRKGGREEGGREGGREGGNKTQWKKEE